MFCKTYSSGLLGIEGFLVDVETDISRGIPQYSLVGLPDSAVKESKERVRSAIINSGYNFPLGRLTVNLAPAHLRKAGAAFDLSVAVGILTASGQIQLPFLQETLFIGELSLDGRIKPVHGILPMALAAKKKGLTKIIVPQENQWEALLSGLTIYPLKHLSDLAQPFSSALSHPDASPIQPLNQINSFPSIVGQQHAKRALEIAAAGFHNILLIGPPGTGKTMLASSLPHLLPPLSNDEFIELLSIHSASGKTLYDPLSTAPQRPFRSPHHSITAMGLIGGGNRLRPGEITLAHHGVLFLDEMSEFPRQQLELLRQPIEERRIHLTRSSHHVIFPARFMLVGSMNPCPCGYYGFSSKTHKCSCNSATLDKFRKKLSGPLLDRFDLQLEMPRQDEIIFSPLNEVDYDVVAVRERIIQAVRMQQNRFNDEVRRNADMTPLEIPLFCALDKSGSALLQACYKELGMSHRTMHRILKIARTIADLQIQENISEIDIAEAVHIRTMQNFFL